MTDYATLKLDFEKLSSAIGMLKRLQSQLDTMDTTPFPEDARNLRALLHSPDKASEAQALMRQLQEKLAARERAERNQQEERRRSAEREKQEEERRFRAERERQRKLKVVHIVDVMTKTETVLSYVLNSATDPDMAAAARNGLLALQRMAAVLQQPDADLDATGAQAEQLFDLASQIAEAQRRGNAGAHGATGGSAGGRRPTGSSGSHEEPHGESGDPLGYYAILGVEPDSTAEEMKNAYRAKVKQYHPDLFAHDDHEWVRQEAAETTRKLNEAWDILGDPVRRRDYDRS